MQAGLIVMKLTNITKTFVLSLLLTASSLCAANPPEAPVLSVITYANTVEIEWTESAEASGYKLYYTPILDIAYVQSVDMGATRSLSVDAPSGTALYIAAAAYNGAAEESYSNVEYFKIWGTDVITFDKADTDITAQHNMSDGNSLAFFNTGDSTIEAVVTAPDGVQATYLINENGQPEQWIVGDYTFDFAYSGYEVTTTLTYPDASTESSTQPVVQLLALKLPSCLTCTSSLDMQDVSVESIEKYNEFLDSVIATMSDTSETYLPESLFKQGSEWVQQFGERLVNRFQRHGERITSFVNGVSDKLSTIDLPSGISCQVDDRNCAAVLKDRAAEFVAPILELTQEAQESLVLSVQEDADSGQETIAIDTDSQSQDTILELSDSDLCNLDLRGCQTPSDLSEGYIRYTGTGTMSGHMDFNSTYTTTDPNTNVSTTHTERCSFSLFVTMDNIRVDIAATDNLIGDTGQVLIEGPSPVQFTNLTQSEHCGSLNIDKGNYGYFDNLTVDSQLRLEGSSAEDLSGGGLAAHILSGYVSSDLSTAYIDWTYSITIPSNDHDETRVVITTLRRR